MAVRSIRTEGDEALRKRCKEVKTVDERVRALLDDMMDTLHATDGAAALAANQVGILKRLVVIDYCGYVLKLVNPVIVGRDGVQECLEGCLSFPGRIAKTIRPKSVTVQALDENGEELLLTGEGEMAKCFCHELEHLDGHLFVEHTDRLYTVEELDAMEKAEEEQ